jgi:hypothetical protein
VYWSAEDFAVVPPGVATVMSTVPADPAGAVALIWVALLTVNDVAGVEPKLTAVALPRPPPLIVTVVPPASGPDAGLTPVTVGALV